MRVRLMCGGVGLSKAVALVRVASLRSPTAIPIPTPLAPSLPHHPARPLHPASAMPCTWHGGTPPHARPWHRTASARNHWVGAYTPPLGMGVWPPAVSCGGVGTRVAAVLEHVSTLARLGDTRMAWTAVLVDIVNVVCACAERTQQVRSALAFGEVRAIGREKSREDLSGSESLHAQPTCTARASAPHTPIRPANAPFLTRLGG